ncbi:ADP-ribosylation factor-like protein 6-interacting protein 1 [Hetaerina americana]|uniref:ADP-ribosylation factor-like protein 6-interacting protein 1 n=1 Tax=Hetaerina americana TaxID=62018 RepID=UPI003A7F3680
MGDLPSQHNQEVMVAELKQKLEGWREVIIPFRSILLWKNPWHTVILLSSVSLMFLMIWWCDLSVVSSFSIAGAVITLADYVGPIAIKTLSDPSNWNTKKEKIFDDICWSLVVIRLRCANMIYWIYDLKANQPLLYYAGTLTTLIALAFFGQIVNNLLLTYFLVIFSLLMPGFWQNDPVKSCFALVGGLMGKCSGKSSTDKKGKTKGN